MNNGSLGLIICFFFSDLLILYLPIKPFGLLTCNFSDCLIKLLVDIRYSSFCALRSYYFHRLFMSLRILKMLSAFSSCLEIGYSIFILDFTWESKCDNHFFCLVFHFIVIPFTLVLLFSFFSLLTGLQNLQFCVLPHFHTE